MDQPKATPEVVVRRVVDSATISVQKEVKKTEAIVENVIVVSHKEDSFLVFGQGAFVSIPDGATVMENGLTERAAKVRARALFGKGVQIEDWPGIVSAARNGTKVQLYLQNNLVKVLV